MFGRGGEGRGREGRGVSKGESRFENGIYVSLLGGISSSKKGGEGRGIPPPNPQAENELKPQDREGT